MKPYILQSPAFMGLCLLSALAFGAATGNRVEDFPTSDMGETLDGTAVQGNAGEGFVALSLPPAPRVRTAWERFPMSVKGTDKL